jgi:hypothetical protein
VTKKKKFYDIDSRHHIRHIKAYDPHEGKLYIYILLAVRQKPMELFLKLVQKRIVQAADIFLPLTLVNSYADTGKFVIYVFILNLQR